MDRKKFLTTIPLLGISSGLLFTACGTEADFDQEDLEGDAILVQNAAEREAIAIQTYTAAAESGLIEDQQTLDTAVLFRSHHREHLVEFNESLSVVGAEPIRTEDFGPDDRIGSVSTEEEAILLAMTLEFEAAEAYFQQLVGQLTGFDPRTLFANIYPVEVSHFITLKTAMGRNPAINSALFQGLTFD